MCFLYEPYLYEKLNYSFPDIKEKMEEFVEFLIFGNPQNALKKISLENDLFYNWSKSRKDIVHLFFIVYKGYDLLIFLKKHNEILISLLEFSNNDSGTLNYILYKITKYFPISKLDYIEPTIQIKQIIFLTYFFK